MKKLRYAWVLGCFITIACQRTDRHTVCFTGDVLLDRGIDAIVKAKGNSHISNAIEYILSPYQYRVINLEGPLTSHKNPLNKSIVFGARPELVTVLQESNITHTSLANNHVNDQQNQGREDTYQTLASAGIAVMGINTKDHAPCLPAELTAVNNNKIAIFSFLDLSLSSEEINGVCACGADNLATKIWEYKNNHPNTVVICYIHWGTEYNPFPAMSQQQTARLLIDAGADAIIGHHPHVIQKIDYYRGKLVLYSLGNFVFDQLHPDTRTGIVAGFDVKDNTLEAVVTPYRIQDGRPVVLSGEESKAVISKLESMSGTVRFIKKDKQCWTLREIKSDSEKIATEVKRKFAPLEIKDAYFKGIASLEKLKSMNGYRLSVIADNQRLADALHIRYPVYRFEAADVNVDGKTDLLLGVIKTTHFEAQASKRLFVFQLDSGQIRPLWLGSKVAQQLVDFKPVRYLNKVNILTIEQDNQGTFANGLYEWRDFGLSLIRYKNEKSNYDKALQFFEHDKD